MTIVPLTCKVQQYAWGKPGSTSKVAEMVEHTMSIQKDQPYAEVTTILPFFLIYLNIALEGILNSFTV